MKKKILIAASAVLLTILIIVSALSAIFACDPWGYRVQVSPEEQTLRQSLIHTAQSWLGAKEGDSGHLEILQIYNQHTPLAQNYVVKPEDNWCAAFVSAAAIVTDLTDIIPTECGCQRQIALFQQLKQWEEEDTYLPLPGDIIYFSSHGVNLLENDAWSDHVGIVVGTFGPFIRVIEGNNNNAVRCRTLISLDPTIRGYATPDYSKKAAQ